MARRGAGWWGGPRGGAERGGGDVVASFSPETWTQLTLSGNFLAHFGWLAITVTPHGSARPPRPAHLLLF